MLYLFNYAVIAIYFAEPRVMISCNLFIIKKNDLPRATDYLVGTD